MPWYTTLHTETSFFQSRFYLSAAAALGCHSLTMHVFGAKVSAFFFLTRISMSCGLVVKLAKYSGGLPNDELNT